MRLVMTMMVRDEADIVGATLEHAFAQGVDQVIVTDNGSVDGTVEILERFASDGRLELRHDPVQLKQQASVVTSMARDAKTAFGADWVVNADADEFWVAADGITPIRDVVEQLDPALGSFPVPVIDMTGSPARSGSGLHRLIHRDSRPLAQMNAVGIHAHATHDALHVGDADVSVVQGNHFVSIPSRGAPPAGLELEVLHLPWRSWSQFRRKAENAGRAYDDNPHVTPSPNHHGMRDWRRLQAGTLFGWYVARHPTAEERDATTDLAVDTRLSYLADPLPDVPLGDDAVEEIRPLIERLQALDDQNAQKSRELEENERQHTELRARIAGQDAELSRMRRRRVVRAADWVSQRLR